MKGFALYEANKHVKLLYNLISLLQLVMLIELLTVSHNSTIAYSLCILTLLDLIRSLIVYRFSNTRSF